MKLNIPITYKTFLWAILLFGITILAIAAGLEKYCQVHAFKPVLIGIGVLGGTLGAVIQFGIIKPFLKCPNCGSFGELSFGYQDGHAKARSLFDCPKCKRLVNKSRISVRVEKEKETVCPECGFEYTEGKTVCPYCSKK